MTVAERIAEYEASQKAEKARIKAMPRSWARHHAMVTFLLLWPFRWMWVNLRDWRTFLIYGIVCGVVSCEVWVPYLIGLVVPGIRATMWAVGSACWVFWLGPGTPFMPLCIAITVGIKSAIDGRRRK